MNCCFSEIKTLIFCQKKLLTMRNAQLVIKEQGTVREQYKVERCLLLAIVSQ